MSSRQGPLRGNPEFPTFSRWRAVSFLEPLRGRPVVVIEPAAKAQFALDVRVAVGRYRTRVDADVSESLMTALDVDPIAIAAGPKKRCETADIWMPIGN